MIHRRCIDCLTILAVAASCICSRADSNVDSLARLRRIPLPPGWLNLSTDIRIPAKNWQKNVLLSSSNPRLSMAGGNYMWMATLGTENGFSVDIEQTITETSSNIVFDLAFRSHNDADIEGLIFQIDLPAKDFAGGSFAAGAQNGDLPPALRQDAYDLADTNTGSLVFADSTRKARIRIDFDRETKIIVQDSRKWKDNFSAMVFVHAGAMKKNDSAKFRISMSTAGQLDETPAHLKLDAAKPLYRITGLGGSYCFGLDSPVPRYTLDHLPVAYSRCEMRLMNWEPVNDNNDPAGADMAILAANDQPGSPLRQSLDIMRELSSRRIPYIISIWRLPPWLYSDPKEKESGNKVPREKWPELIESVGSYLVYARDKYKAEADYFSFNEPNGGIRVDFTPEEHRDFIKLLGARLAWLGLKTRMLLGDVSYPRNTEGYALVAAADASAMKHVGALSFHSWGGARPDQYAKWAALAERLKLPLIVAEVGLHSDWRTAAYKEVFAYVEDMTLYQSLFLHAKPQALIYWEFSEDYSLINVRHRDPPQLELTERYYLQKHWLEFIPPGSESLQTTNDNAHVMFTAFRFNHPDGKTGYTLQIANPDWRRKVMIEGLPAGIQKLNAVRTGRREYFKSLPSFEVHDGKLTLEAAERSLTTLTTLAPSPAEPVLVQ